MPEYHDEQKDEFSTVLERLDVEWVTLVALRDAIGMALKDSKLSSYPETMRLAEVLAPVLFHRDRSLLRREWESPEARECRAVASASSVPFEEIVKSRIKAYEGLLKQSKTPEDAKVFSNKLDKLSQIYQENRTREYFEGRIIQRDAGLGVDLPISRQGDDYYDFALPSRMGMRVRVTHDTNVEGVTGADLIYEHHLIDLRRVRVAAIQYKIMTKERYVPKSEKLKKQLNRLKANFCDGLPCAPPDQGVPSQFFRLPSCAAFLRPTNKAQSANERMMSTGYYVPVCRARSMWEADEVISMRSFEGETVTYRVFEELFNTGMLGSQWLRYEDLEKVYREQKVLERNDSVAMHVQVVQESPS
jgi:hypothetical protein